MANPAGRTAKAPPNGKELIEALVSRNLAPSILENAQPGQIPLFAKDYNWADQDRVRGAIQHLVDHAERVWPDIVAHLDDNRYSITYELFDAPKNLSVADVCKWIISDYLSQAYIWHIPEIGERQFWAFYIPDVARHGNAALKVWCEVRSKKKLYELQIEICDWAIPKATASDGPLSEFSEERRRAVVAGIKGEIAELRESKRAVKVEHFGVRGADAWGLYTRERIENKKKAAAKGEGMF